MLQLEVKWKEIKAIAGTMLAGPHFKCHNLYTVNKKRHDDPVAAIVTTVGMVFAFPGCLHPGKEPMDHMVIGKKGQLLPPPEFRQLGQWLRNGWGDVAKLPIVRPHHDEDGVGATIDKNNKANVPMYVDPLKPNSEHVLVPVATVKQIDKMYSGKRTWRLLNGDGTEGPKSRKLLVVCSGDVPVAIILPIYPAAKQQEIDVWLANKDKETKEKAAKTNKAGALPLEPMPKTVVEHDPAKKKAAPSQKAIDELKERRDAKKATPKKKAKPKK